MSVGAPDAIRWDEPIGGCEYRRESERSRSSSTSRIALKTFARWSVIFGQIQFPLLFRHTSGKSLRSRVALVNQKSWVLIITTREMTSTVIETNDMTNDIAQCVHGGVDALQLCTHWLDMVNICGCSKWRGYSGVYK